MGAASTSLQWRRSIEDAFALLAGIVEEGKDLRVTGPHVVFLEGALAERSGVEFLRRLRAHPKLRRLPAVLLLERPDPDRAREAYEAGANSCLALPTRGEDQTEFFRGLYEWWCRYNEPPGLPA